MDDTRKEQVSKEVMGLIADFRPNSPPKVRQHKIILRYTKTKDGDELHMTVEHWKAFILELNQAAKVLGVDLDG